jgi:predicted NBD/HSP70 family sugar kinase
MSEGGTDMKKNYLSIDIGGTNIKLALIDHSGQIQSKKQVRTPNELDAFIATLEEEINLVRDEIRGIAFCCPGKVNTETGVISFGGALPFLDGVSFVEAFQPKFQVPVSVINDGKAAALSELWLGNLKGIENGLALVLGTGIGGGLILEGKLYQGKHFQAGELSFMMQQSDKPSFDDMYGKTGSAVGLVKKVNLELGTEDTKDGAVAFEAINQQDPNVYPIFEAFAREIAYMICNVQAILDLEKIVIGGGISAQPIVTDEIRKQYRAIRASLPFLEGTLTEVEIDTCRFLNDANLLGALYQLLLNADEEMAVNV